MIKKKRDRRVKLTKAFVKHATNESTLRKMAGKSLDERCILLHRDMPDVKIKGKTLSSIYKAHGIKKKVIRKKHIFLA